MVQTPSSNAHLPDGAVEEKVDLLLSQVKEIQIEQAKHYTKLDSNT